MKSVQKFLLSARQSGCSAQCMPMEGRGRISKKSLVLGLVVVAVVAVFVLVAEGIVTFGANETTTLKAQDDNGGTISPEVSKLTESADGTKVSGGSNGESLSSVASTTESVVCSKADEEAEAVKVTSKCRKCQEHEDDELMECGQTGNVEQIVTCKKGGKTHNRKYQSCARPAAAEERRFVVFEVCQFGLGIASYAVVLIRRKRQDLFLAKKIESQLASGV